MSDYYTMVGDRVGTSPGSVAASVSTGVTIASTACNLATIASVSSATTGGYPTVGFTLHGTTTSGGNVAAYCWGGSSTTCNTYMAAGSALDEDTCRCRDPSKIWLRSVAGAISNCTVNFWLRDPDKKV